MLRKLSEWMASPEGQAASEIERFQLINEVNRRSELLIMHRLESRLVGGDECAMSNRRPRHGGLELADSGKILA